MRSIVAAVLVWLAAFEPLLAAELIMFRREGCPYCLAWDRAIGPIYPKSDIGKRVPIRMIELGVDEQREVQLRMPVLYTPTFVLVDEGREIGRIEGYPGEDLFWGLLENLVKRLPAGS